MRKWMAVIGCLAFLGASTCAMSAPTDDVYKLGPDSMTHDGVPHGKLVGPLTLASNVYPNTTRNYWVYVPAQYDAKSPASLMIFFDGHAFLNPNGDFRIPNVFDNLIYRREMPVTLAVFVNPGHSQQQPESTDLVWGDGVNNRAIEYNALDDKYSKLVVDELLPAVEKDYDVSTDPADHALAGASSGAICAFTVAWHRPDVFRKVISTIGSFTNIMGGNAYPDIILKSKKEPIRIFLQDGLNDNRGVRNGKYDAGWDWHLQNIRMVDAFTKRGYDMAYTFGIGTHSTRQGGAIIPEMLRWLWRDYPRVDDPHDDGNRVPFVTVDALK